MTKHDTIVTTLYLNETEARTLQAVIEATARNLEVSSLQEFVGDDTASDDAFWAIYNKLCNRPAPSDQ